MSVNMHDIVVSEMNLSELSWSWIIDLLGTMVQKQVSNWAILLVKFNDDPKDEPDITHYERLFTGAGTGSMNMVDFFLDMSHGQVDISGSKVFGWYTVPASRKNYVGNTYPQPAGKLNRDGLLNLARTTATNNGVDLSKFDGVVVSTFGGTDLCGWVGGMAALCDQNSLQPSLLGQEMGHGFGLDHARHDGSNDDYRDPWDVMSTAAYPHMQQPHDEYASIGPGLNAWNMRSRGWLDERRVWSGEGAFDTTITLRPLHQRGLFGYLAAQVGKFLVEFRVPELWDAAIGEPCVLVHRFQDNHSYLMTDKNGADALTTGSVFEYRSLTNYGSEHYRVEVIAIDAENRTVTLRVASQPKTFERIPDLVAQVFGGVAVDGGGFIVIGGKRVPIPPRGPMRQLVEQVVRYLEVDASADPAAATSMRRTLMADVARTAIRLRADAEIVSHHPPGYEIRE